MRVMSRKNERRVEENYSSARTTMVREDEVAAVAAGDDWYNEKFLAMDRS